MQNNSNTNSPKRKWQNGQCVWVTTTEATTQDKPTKAANGKLSAELQAELDDINAILFGK